MVPNVEVHIFAIHFEHPQRGQPLYKGQDAWSHNALYKKVSSLYSGNTLTSFIFNY